MLITALLISSGCSESSTEPTGDETVQQQLYKNIELREGVSIVHEDNTGTGLMCVNGDLTLTGPDVRQSLSAVDQQDELQNNSLWHRAFWVNKKDDVETVLRQNLDATNGSGPLNFDRLDGVVREHFGNVFFSSDEPVVTLLVVIPTADHFVSTNNTGPCVSVPPQSPLDPQPEKLEDWVRSCGVRYLEEVKYGHYFLMSASLNNLQTAFGAEPEQGWAMFTQLLQIEAANNQTNTLDAISTLEQRYPGIEFLVTAANSGVDYPDWHRNWWNFPYLPIFNFSAFVEHYQKAGAEGVAREDFSLLGVPVWQYTPVYQPKSYMEEICGLRMSDIDVAFGCYNDFEEAERSYTQRVIPQLDVYLDALQYPSKYEQPNDAADWQDFIANVLTPLEQSLPTLKSDCLNSLSSGDAATICGACDPSPIRDVIASFGSLTRPQRTIPPTNPNFQLGGIYHYLLTNNQTEDLGPIEDKFCAYTWVGGKLEGLGEGTSLTRSRDRWKAETFSQQTAFPTRLRAEVTCTDSIVRSANCGGTYCKWSETCVADKCQVSQEYMDTTETFKHSVNNQDVAIEMWAPLGYPSSPYLATFAGISGKTRGLAEEVLAIQGTSSDPPSLRVRTLQGTMSGWANGFKITDNAYHQFFEVNPGSVTENYEALVTHNTLSDSMEFTLAPENQAFCFLTSVGGDFAGAAESARILRKSGSWVLSLRSLGDGVRARARCVEYIQ